ncbi:MAG: Uma2 family endonuclease [Chloroflexaceae bacterium]|nr:Uma2 family endonuclease [Chloroflexaceae bacterium]
MSIDIHHPPTALEQLVYPESDGQPMADNTLQFRWIVIIKENLETLFQQRPDVFVAGDLLWYPVEGRPDIRRAPDAMVVFGRPKGDRGAYLQWKEAHIAPQVVFEVLSPGNTPSEMARKLLFYQQYGVVEYYLYDPDTNTLHGWLRQDEQLLPIPTMAGWVSPRLGMRFDLSGPVLVLYSPDGERFLSHSELHSQRNTERSRAEQERSRAEQERSRAEQAEQRAERLAARLRELGIDPNDMQGQV